MSSPQKIQQLIITSPDGSPYAQKTKLLLTAAGIPFQKCNQPRILPRPDLEALGITYRRIPLLAVGKDVYADSQTIIDVIMHRLAASGSNSVPTSPADKAWDNLGTSIFREVVLLMDPDVLPREFIQDRKTIFPVIARPDFKSLHPSALAGVQSRFAWVENTLFTSADGGPYPIGGSKLTLADIHILWSIRWGLTTLGAGQEKGCRKEDLPKIWKAIEALPEPKPEVLGSETTIERIQRAEYFAQEPTRVRENDPLGFKAGTMLSVESNDSAPGVHTQLGKLIGTNLDEVVLEVGTDGVRLHLPRLGYIYREPSSSSLSESSK
ncbi:hypothetical protein LTR62_006651 [Meristemomyces frigidus]|uniref:GST N-terminal domain-containing protein n=1 Tax=Meristemomyces frigidus TaxID=1508187 RepID=A0AAN7YRT0_9PEZI|nr:hypothetical protein LTR62_006651 [Meristemomyces frigidus]